jgi:hypothetical protein
MRQFRGVSRKNVWSQRPGCWFPIVCNAGEWGYVTADNRGGYVIEALVCYV